MAIRGVLFDKDGTLIESSATWVPIYKTFLAEVHEDGPDGVNALMVKAGYDEASDSFLAGGILAAGTTKQAMEIWWPHLDAAGIDKKCQLLDHDYAPLARDLMKPLMPLIPIFDELHALGLQLGVATNDTFRSATNHMVDLGVHDYFVELIGSDSVAVPKPSGQMIARF
ncbi:MAG: HAD family hydrolase, partial [Alphaproteobacteria bacterium]|nr:HAD family hydrolase [Alphaproteobacteria bacterium]